MHQSTSYLDISLQTHPSAGLDVLEIGCGTGLLSFRIAPYVRSLLAVDASTGMIDALNQKLRTQADAPKNVTPLCVMLEDPEDPSLPAATAAVSSDREGPRRKFDLILSHLVLHHIADLSALLTTMFGCLKQGGRVALTDFEDFGPEARKFHPEAKMAGVERDGVKREWFQGLLREAGFVDVKVEVGWTMEKEVERWPGEWGQKKPDGGCASMVFPFLVLEGRRP